MNLSGISEELSRTPERFREYVFQARHVATVSPLVAGNEVSKLLANLCRVPDVGQESHMRSTSLFAHCQMRFLAFPLLLLALLPLPASTELDAVDY